MSPTPVNVNHNMDSRYRPCRAFRDAGGNIFLESPPQTDYSREPMRTHKVTYAEQNRLDRVAYKYYGQGSLWWIIAQANRLIDPFVLREGDVINIPDMDSIYRVRGLRE